MSMIVLIFFFSTRFSEAHSYRIYVVKKNDTLIRISNTLGIPRIAIENDNIGINWLKIVPNEKIHVPLRHLKSGFGKVNNGYYVVKNGDSLVSIARKFSVSINTIKKFNRRISDIIYPGEVIFLPVSITKRFISPAKKIRVYRETKKSSFITITKDIHPKMGIIKPFVNTTFNSFHADNLAIYPNKIINRKSIIRKLRFKKPPRPGTIGDGYYIVKKGDTLSSIAAMFGLAQKTLMQMNPHISTLIRPNEIIYIPKSICRKINIAEENDIFISPRYLRYSMIYRVKFGDSLWKISHKFKVDEEMIRILNNLHRSIIHVGQVLFIPNIKLKAVKKVELELSILRTEREAVIKYAEKFVRDPYVWGGDSLRYGVDCSGFVQQIFRRFLIYLPRTAQEQYFSRIGIRVKLSDIKPGDLLFFHTLPYAYATHVAIYIGNDRIVQALDKRTGVIISRLNGYYLRHFIGAKRIIGARIKFLVYKISHNRSG